MHTTRYAIWLGAFCCGEAAVASSVANSDVVPHSVSGFSAGASAAVNHFVAFSSIVQGIGIVGGSPYGCSTLPDADYTCSGWQVQAKHLENKTIPWKEWVATLRREYILEREMRGAIDPVQNLHSKPVFLLSGTDDTWVYQSVMRGVAEQFLNFNSKVKTQFALPAAHSWVVDNATCSPHRTGHQFPKEQCCGWKNGSTACPLPPNARKVSSDGCCGICQAGDADDSTDASHNHCKTGWRPPIVNCDYDMSGELLRWIFGVAAIKPRGQMIPENLVIFNQSDWLPENFTLQNASLDALGFIYAPASCRNADVFGRKKRCPIHVHYHPCGGSVRQVSTSYFLQNGLPQYAESNDLVIIYPQAGADNPEGAACFDWDGFTGIDFDTKAGAQLMFVMNVIRALPTILPETAQYLAL